MNDRGVVRRREQPVLRFADYGVAFHLAQASPEESEPDPELTSPSLEASALESYERDMLLHAYRQVAPLVTRRLGRPARVTFFFPSELLFESEGRPIQLACWGAGPTRRRRRAHLVASRTTFPGSRVAVVTLVLRPPPSRAPRSRLNEYDLIKLAKLWEGGEGLPEPGSPAGERGPVQFDRGEGEVGVEGLVGSRTDWSFATQAAERGASAGLESGRHYRVGTIALMLPATRENRQLLADARAVKDRQDALPPEDSDRWRRIVALGGLIQGLLDFEEIGPDELSDVFAEAELDEESLLAFHKGTLLTLSLEESSNERDSELARAIGMSPYLAIPHAVLLHNEQRLKSALIDVNELLQQQQGDRLLSVGTRRVPLPGGRISIADTELGIRAVSDALAQHLPNVFHYQSERALYDEGTKSRGFDDFEPLIQARLSELQGRLDSRVRQRDNWTLGLTLTFFAIAALQLALRSVPWWGSLLILVALAGVVWQLRRRLF